MAPRPASDEFEVAILGRGKGECVVCHLGDNRWMVVDSFCGSDGSPIALEYLAGYECSGSDVHVVVASHWDDDHTLGLAELAKRSSGKVWFSIVTSRDEAASFAYLHHRRAPKDGFPSGTSTFVKTLEETPAGKLRWAIEDKYVDPGTRARVRAISPSDPTVSDGIAALGGNLLGTGDEFVGVTPNAASVALWIDAGPRSVLLGADLLRGSDGRGWDGVLLLDLGRADVHKIPHHGSANADDPRVHGRLVTDEPLRVATRFTASGRPLPRGNDRERLRALPGTGLVVGRPPRKDLADRPEINALRDAQTVDGVWQATGPVGVVRARWSMTRPGPVDVQRGGWVEPL